MGARGCGTYFVLVDCGELIANLDASASTRSAPVDSVGGKSALMLDPPHAVVWNLELPLRRQVITGVNHGSRGQQSQQDGRESDLKIPVHAPYRLRRPQGKNILPPLLHFHCHQGRHRAASKTPRYNSFQYYRGLAIVRLRFLE